MKYIFGCIEIKETQRLENGEIILGCIATRYDRNGEVISRTEVDTMRAYLPCEPMTIDMARSFGAKV